MFSEEDGAVKIAVRERPFIQRTAANAKSVVTYHSINKNIIIVNERPYEFDHCLGPDVSQKELYDALVKPLVEKTLQGYFCSALAYGQTGTGKTFTMGLHSEYFYGESLGVIPRSLDDIFRLADDIQDQIEISVSFVEIYNEKVYDLLAEDTNEQVNIKGFKFGGGMKKVIKNAQEGFTALTQGNKCRHTRPTKMNPESSRSHAIFTLHVTGKTSDKQTNSLLHLVDLAGSEGVRRTGHQGIAFTEGIHINQGLLSIGKVLQALATKQKVVPYRDSVLSSVLQDSLKSNSYLTLLACISPFQEDLSETMSTLRFAADAKSLKHSPQINSILLEIKKNKMKTPQKTFQLPLRPFNGQIKTPAILKNAFMNGEDEPLSAIKKPMHSNTFCTPNKVKRLNVKPLNQTDIGLTPKEKMKFGEINAKFDPLPINLPPLSDSMMRKHNESIDSRSSLMSMNVSTSTLLDAPATTNENTYSPIVRRCETLETKIEKLFDYMKEVYASNKENSEKPLEVSKPINHESTLNGISWSSIRSELHNVIREEILSITSNNFGNKTQTQQQSDTIVDVISHRTQPFAQSSPICKAIELRKRFSFDETPKAPNETVIPNKVPIDQTTIFFQSTRIGDNTVANETVIPTCRRTSRRLSHQVESNHSVARSLQTRKRKDHTPILGENDSGKQLVSRRLSISMNRPKERRDSIRRSMRIQERSSMMSITEDSSIKRSVRKAVGKTVPINNKTIAEYFKPKSVPTKSKTKAQSKDAQQKHEKAVLDLLNNGNIRELQILPQIGLKTAYQIITQRTLNGKFKNFNQISKLPVWRGKAWKRFKLANSIS